MAIYNKKYIGQIKIEPIEPEGFSVYLFIHGSHSPIVISAQLPLQKFKKFIIDEIRLRQLHKNDFLSLNRKYITNQCND